MTDNQTDCHMSLMLVIENWFKYLTQTKHEKKKSSIGNHMNYLTKILLEDIIPDIG